MVKAVVVVVVVDEERNAANKAADSKRVFIIAAMIRLLCSKETINYFHPVNNASIAFTQLACHMPCPLRPRCQLQAKKLQELKRSDMARHTQLHFGPKAQKGLYSGH